MSSIEGEVDPVGDGGAGVCAAVAAAIAAAGFTGVFTTPPSALFCAEPIVVSCGAWERRARFVHGSERGVREVDVAVCRDTPEAAEAAAQAIEAALRKTSWEADIAAWHVRMVGCDSTAREPRGRDGSGRWVWGFTLRCEVMRHVGDSA